MRRDCGVAESSNPCGSRRPSALGAIRSSLWSPDQPLDPCLLPGPGQPETGLQLRTLRPHLPLSPASPCLSSSRPGDPCVSHPIGHGRRWLGPPASQVRPALDSVDPRSHGGKGRLSGQETTALLRVSPARCTSVRHLQERHLSPPGLHGWGGGPWTWPLCGRRC